LVDGSIRWSGGSGTGACRREWAPRRCSPVRAGSGAVDRRIVAMRPGRDEEAPAGDSMRRAIATIGCRTVAVGGPIVALRGGAETDRTAFVARVGRSESAEGRSGTVRDRRVAMRRPRNAVARRSGSMPRVAWSVPSRSSHPWEVRGRDGRDRGGRLRRGLGAVGDPTTIRDFRDPSEYGLRQLLAMG
jgi:hypothetical protein